MSRLTASVLILCGVTTLPAQARLNLPQTDETVTVADEQASILGRFAGNSEPGPRASVAPDVERAVIASLPSGFRQGCEAMIDSWATANHPQNRAILKIRDLGRPEGATGRFLVCRCFSTLPGSEKSYDERLAYLHESAGKLVLRLFAHGKAAHGDSTLSRIDPAAGAHFPGLVAAGFKIAESNENPCCDGGDRYWQEKAVYTALAPSGAYIAAALLNSRTDRVHDDIDGDVEVRLVAQWRATRNRQGETTEFVGQYRTTEEAEKAPTKKTVKSGQMLQRWNARSRRFDTVQRPPQPLIH
jgi:hypothetical protein